VIGFPHGNSTAEVKMFEATRAVYEGGREVDFVVNVGRFVASHSSFSWLDVWGRKELMWETRVRSGKWEYIKYEITRVNEVVVDGGGILKVIFENDCKCNFWRRTILIVVADLTEDEIIKLCKICTEVGVAYIKTSTGYGFNKLPSGDYNYKGATIPHLELMRKHVGPDVRIKAAGGVRTLDDLLRVRALGVSRVGATATEAILEEAIRRGIGMERRSVEVIWEGYWGNGMDGNSMS
jgi:deoxyribose-phosphate aldolase